MEVNLDKINLIIGIPHSAPVMYTKFSLNMFSIIRQLNADVVHFNPLFDYNYAVNNNASLPLNRNQLVYDSLKKSATHILFLDSDIIVKPELIQKMLTTNLPVIGLLCFTRNSEKPEPIIYKDGKIMDPFPEGIIEVDSTGTGCLLIKREVFAAIYDLQEFKSGGNRFFVYNEMWGSDLECKKLGEDRSFCALAKRAGFKIYVDTVNTCEHLNPEGIGIKQYREVRQKAYLPIVIPSTVAKVI